MLLRAGRACSSEEDGTLDEPSRKLPVGGRALPRGRRLTRLPLAPSPSFPLVGKPLALPRDDRLSCSPLPSSPPRDESAALPAAWGSPLRRDSFVYPGRIVTQQHVYMTCASNSTIRPSTAKLALPTKVESSLFVHATCKVCTYSDPPIGIPIRRGCARSSEVCLLSLLPRPSLHLRHAAGRGVLTNASRPIHTCSRL